MNEFEDVLQDLYKIENRFREEVRDRFGFNIGEEVLEPMENKVKNMITVDEESDREESSIRDLLAELRTIQEDPETENKKQTAQDLKI
jgi:hypothetical protein